MSRKWAVFAIAGIFLTAALIPENWVQGLPLCIFHQLTGWDCPGCGLTRAFLALFHGEWRKAIEFNALAPVIVLYLAIYAADAGYTWRFGKRPQWFTPQGNKIITFWFAGLAFGQWIYKSGLHLFNIYFN